MKRYILLFTCLTLGALSCKQDKKDDSIRNQIKSSYNKIQGKTMGTTYNITFSTSDKPIKKEAIDSILIAINLSVSTYIDTSTISRINRQSSLHKHVEILVDGKLKSNARISLPNDPHFIKIYKAAEHIWRQSDGCFDPTVMPLVNYWGFGYTPKNPVTDTDKVKVAALLKSVGLEKISLEHNDREMILVKPADAQLDFSAIAKGYAVDELAAYLSGLGSTDMLVEIGGEMIAKGVNPDGNPWRVGLNKPVIKAAQNEVSEIVQVHNKALASSGNYRIYHTVGDKRYGHELNPKTGFPEQNEVLAVSVTAPTCMEADAVATALMVMGLNRGKIYIEDRPQLEACFFLSNDDGEILSEVTRGFAEMLSENKPI